MTPLREIVERIFNDFCLDEFTVEKEQRFKESVESILKEVVEEAERRCLAESMKIYKEGTEEAHSEGLEIANATMDSAIEQARSVAFEEAALLADPQCPNESVCRVMHYEKLAAKIRALKDKP